MNDRDLERAMLEAQSTPDGFAVTRLGLRLYPWQATVLNALDEPHSRVALRTCNESGKTSTVIAPLVLWHMMTFSESLTVTTAGVYRQVRDQLYPNLRAYAQRLGPTDWKIADGRGMYLPGNSRLVSFSTDDAGLAEGWHEPPRTEELFKAGENPLEAYGVSDEEWEAVCDEKTSLLIVIDEAKSVPQGIFDAFERCRPTRYLVASSPGAPEGAFFNCFYSQRHRYRRMAVDATMCPHLWDDPVKRRELEEQIESLPEPLVNSMVWGKFSQIGEYMVFDMVAVARAMSGRVPIWGRGTRRGALDLANGGDETVLMIRDGNDSWIEGVWTQRMDRRTAREIIARMQQHQLQPEWVSADNSGLGQVAINIFDDLGWPLRRIEFGGIARRPKFYANVRAEMYFECRDRVKKDELRLPNDDILRTQLSWQRYKPSDGAIRLVPKDQLPGSPDRSDTLVMLYYDMPRAEEYADRAEQLRLANSRTMTGADSSLFERDDSGRTPLSWND